MGTIRGTYANGTVNLNAPADWPEGIEVVVTPADDGSDELPDDLDDSPAAIGRRLALMDQVQPWMSPEEEAAWNRLREERKAAGLADWDQWTRDVGKPFE